MHRVKTHHSNRIIVNINEILTIGMCSSLVYIGKKQEKVINIQLVGEYK